MHCHVLFELAEFMEIINKFFRNSLTGSTQMPFSVAMYSKNIACI